MRESASDSAPTRALALDTVPDAASAPTSSPQTVHVITESGDGPLANIVGGAFTDRELVLAEASTARLHFYDRESGAFLRTLTLQGDAGARQPTPIAVFADGSILGERVMPEDGVSEQGVLLPTMPSVMAVRYMLSRHAPDGALLATLVPYRGSESFVAPNSGGGATSGPALFGGRGAAVTVDATVVVKSSEADSIVQYTHDGTRLRALRPPPTRAVAVRATDVARARALAVPKGAAPFDIGAVFDLQTPPEYLPQFGWASTRRLPPVISASDGSLWVLRYGGVRSKATVYLRFTSSLTHYPHWRLQYL